MVARLVGDRGHRPLATAREERSSHSAPYGSANPRVWDLPSHGRVFPAHRCVPRDRRADGAPRQTLWYGTRWRRIRGAHGYGCVHGAAARMGHRSGTAASSCSALPSRRKERFGFLHSESTSGSGPWLFAVHPTNPDTSSSLSSEPTPPARGTVGVELKINRQVVSHSGQHRKTNLNPP
jgi:hypothetical protein